MVEWLVSAFVSATLQVVIQNLFNMGKYACGAISGFDDKLKRLVTTLAAVQRLIAEAEYKQTTDMEWKIWLKEVEEFAYDADDLIDQLIIEASKQEGGHHKRGDAVRKHLVFLLKGISLSKNVNDIQTKLDVMLGKVSDFLSRERSRGKQLDRLVSKLQTTSTFDDPALVFGRKDDTKKIVDMLNSSEESYTTSNVAIIPIVGMIGVGKTTLARLLYHHDDYKLYLRIWVSVPENFDIRRIMRDMIQNASSEVTSEYSTLQWLEDKLKEILREKKFLLILDDLWDVKSVLWYNLMKPLKQGSIGSKIIVTTGSGEVARLVRTNNMQYDLQCLEYDDCWSLLKREALGNMEDPCLEAIGKDIARKCNGLPLAAKILGQRLRLKLDRSEWREILRSKIWQISSNNNEILSALRAGYGRLPSVLRHCFAYCSMFPQNYSFEKEKMIKMWMGEGLIVPDDENYSMEEIGGKYFDMLFTSSFFHMEGEKYKIHDVFHELAQAVSGYKFHRLEDANLRLDKNLRHLSVLCANIQPITFVTSGKCKSLRTFLLAGAVRTNIKKVPPALFDLKRLRVLDLSATLIEHLTASISKLKHLRFLDLSNTHLESLPDTMRKLYVLQTVRLINCSKLLSLPISIGKVQSLRHLELGGNNLSSMPSGIGELSNLQTINEFIVTLDHGKINELKEMNNIRGFLCIRQLENVTNEGEAIEANLAKKHIKKLEMQWTDVVDAEAVLEKLTPNQESLQELTLRKYGGTKFPRWVGDPSFSELTSISCYECLKCDAFPPLGQLQNLLSLTIVGMSELRTLEISSVANNMQFRSLETLKLSDMQKLERWDGSFENFMNCLFELTIADCPLLVSIPSVHHLGYLKELQLEDCPQLPYFSEEKLSKSMKSLVVTGCDKLEVRCGSNGDDWTKIQHICFIEIGNHIVAPGIFIHCS